MSDLCIEIFYNVFDLNKNGFDLRKKNVKVFMFIFSYYPICRNRKLKFAYTLVKNNFIILKLHIGTRYIC